jgi:hypothetical protein
VFDSDYWFFTRSALASTWVGRNVVVCGHPLAMVNGHLQFEQIHFGILLMMVGFKYIMQI